MFMNVCGGSSNAGNENSVALGSWRWPRGGSGGASGEPPGPDASAAAMATGRAIDSVAVLTACLGDAMAGGEDGGGDR